MLQISLDWLEFTSNYLLPDPLFEALNYEPDYFRQLESGQWGYKMKFAHPEENIYILFDGSSSMGAHLSVSGHSIDALMSHLQTDQLGLIKLLHELGGKFTRLDFACDDVRAEYYTVQSLRKLFQKDCYIGAFRQYSIIDSYEADTGMLLGETLYCGRRISDRMLRIYNKKLEHNNKLPDDKIEEEITRWELEIKHDAANAASMLFMELKDLRKVYFSILTDFIRLIKRNADERKTRCPTLKSWENFTDSIPAARITASKKILTIDEKKRWLWNQTAKSFSLVDMVDPEFYDRLVKHGGQMLTKRDLAIL